jgi:antitoxin (DNA-binding transcriptional repressor) of toxin-antitoxin stability system
MSSAIISVADAASDFPRVLAHVEASGESVVLVRDGRSVAQIIPLGRSNQPARTGHELAERWKTAPRLPPDEAEAFARDLEDIHRNQPPLRSLWD